MHDNLQEPAWLRRSLIALAVLVMASLVVLPLAMVLAAAFGDGFAAWWAALAEPDARDALKLTLFTAAIVIPINAVFGTLMAWAVTRFEFGGKRILLTLIDLPFAVSPVVAGLCLVQLFSTTHGWFPHAAAKASVEALVRNPAVALGPRVRVNGLAPGIVLPPDDLPARTVRRLVGKTPLGRREAVPDVVAMAVAIAANRSMTGHVVGVDAGRSCV